MANNPKTYKMTMRQKLTAIHLKYYQGMEWCPQEGDYFTTMRADLVLFHIAKIEGRRVIVSCCTDSTESEFDLGSFTTGGIGSLRVHVPKLVLESP